MEVSSVTQDLLETLEILCSRRSTAPWSDFSQGELRVLHHLADCGRAAMLPGELSADLSLSSARVAATLRQLEEKGLISREMSHVDRRKIHVYLTPEGRRYIEKRYECVVQSTEKLVDFLGQEDARAARSLLQAGHAARELTELHHHAPPPEAAPPRCWLTQSERFLGLLEVLQKYGGQQSAHAFAQLRRYITLRDRLIGMRYGGAVSLPDIAALLDNGSTGAAAQLQQAMAMANAVSGMQGQAGLPQMLQMLSQFSH